MRAAWQACRSGISAVAVEAFMNNVGLRDDFLDGAEGFDGKRHGASSVKAESL